MHADYREIMLTAEDIMIIYKRRNNATRACPDAVYAPRFRICGSSCPLASEI